MHGLPALGKASILSLFLVAVAPRTAAVPQDRGPVSFSQEVLPLLQQKCFTCHGEAQQMSALDLRSRESALKGGLHGPALVPGKPEESRLFRRVAGLEQPSMPFGGSLSQPEIDLLRRWVAQGAEWDVLEAPRAAPAHSSQARPASAEREISEADRQWWAFQKAVRHPIPQVSDPRWNQNPVDAFLMKKMEEKGLKPAPAADRHILIRRAYLDLTGLLPAPDEVQAFVKDESPHFFANLIDRLLDSPHYGERWGRHWLDVARYADSGGYEHDYDYPNAWRYRDYVIRAFNQDNPYDQFIFEQLAGDELDAVTQDSLIATGFNRVGATVGFREKDNPQYRYMYLDDMIATSSRAFMALSVECARCHDHKFDPIRQLDYYRTMAIFFPYVNYDHPLAPPEKVSAYEARKAEVEAQMKPLRERVQEIEEPYRKMAFDKKLAQFPEDIQLAVRTPEEERTPGQKLLAAQVLSMRGGGIDELLSAEDRAKLERLKEQIKELERQLPEALPEAMGIRDGDYRFAPDGRGDEVIPGKGEREFYDFEGTFLPVPGNPYVPPTAHLLPTADYRNKGPQVQPGFLQVLSEGNPPTAILPSNGQITSGRRRALAEWLVSEDHPLTARVMVNRIWQYHFGHGIAGTANNFGRMGQPPTHPELLDWLATEFMGQGWSIKQMHRLMMNSQAYQMSASHYSESNAQIDPENTYLWRYRQRRLEGEIIRDIILAASGKLNVQMGGEPFFPPIAESVRESFPKGYWKVMEEGPEVWRRSIYSYWKRGLRYPVFDVFDLPNLNVSCERRVTTTVPTQSLTLLNNEFVIQQARYFAERILKDAGPDPSARIRQAYWIALSREPTPAELDHNGSFLRLQREYHAQREGISDPDLEALNDLCHVILNLNEFVYIN